MELFQAAIAPHAERKASGKFLDGSRFKIS